jgi:phosphatidylglycerol:prolipoprotein diacylglycerol transferase
MTPLGLITINLDPTLLDLGPLAISWHGFFGAVAAAAMLWWSLRRARARAIAHDLGGAAWAVGIGAVTGARLAAVVEAWPYYASHPLEILAVTEGGIAAYGGILGGMAALWLYCGWRRLPSGRLFDVAGPPMLLGLAIGRIGDIINGEHLAIPSGLPWAVEYVNPNTLGQRGVAVHPEVAYEMLMLLAIVAAQVVLWRLPRLRGLAPGAEFAAGLLAYAVGRFFLSYLRINPTYVFGLREAQLLGIAAAVIAGAVLVRALATGPRAGLADSAWLGMPRARRVTLNGARPTAGASAPKRTVSEPWSSWEASSQALADENGAGHQDAQHDGGDRNIERIPLEHEGDE